MAHLTESFKYASVGVNRSAGIDAVTGSRLGAQAVFLVAETTPRAVSNDGTVMTCLTIAIGMRKDT